MQTDDTNLFLSNLARVLAHTVTYEHRSQAPSGYDCYCLDETRQSLQQAPRAAGQAVKAFDANLPQILQTIAEQYGILDQAQGNAAGAAAKQQSELTESLLPIFARIAQASNVYQDMASPGSSELRNSATDQMTNLIKSYRTGAPSHAEQQADERTVNAAASARGNVSRSSAVGGLQDALQFDDRKQNRLARLESVLQTAGNFMPASQVGQLNVAQGAMSATAPGSFGHRAGDSTNQLGSQWLSATTGMQNQYNQLNAGLPSTLDQLNKAASFGGSVIGSLTSGVGGGLGLCWVARAAFGPNDVRWKYFRTWMLFKSPQWFFNLYQQQGERFADWLNKHPSFKPVVRWFMEKAIKQ